MVYNIYTKGTRSNFDNRQNNAEKTTTSANAHTRSSRVQRKSATSNQSGVDGFVSFAVNMLVFEGLKRVTRFGGQKSQKPTMRKSESFAAEIHTLASS
jgi:hypothetical protein